jgi:hypothetical protein
VAIGEPRGLQGRLTKTPHNNEPVTKKNKHWEGRPTLTKESAVRKSKEINQTIRAKREMEARWPVSICKSQQLFYLVALIS